jgi:hypothetical protein
MTFLSIATKGKPTTNNIPRFHCLLVGHCVSFILQLAWLISSFVKLHRKVHNLSSDIVSEIMCGCQRKDMSRTSEMSMASICEWGESNVVNFTQLQSFSLLSSIYTPTHKFQLYMAGRKRINETLWWEFFWDPSQWWDHRSENVTEIFLLFTFLFAWLCSKSWYFILGYHGSLLCKLWKIAWLMRFDVDFWS